MRLPVVPSAAVCALFLASARLPGQGFVDVRYELRPGSSWQNSAAAAPLVRPTPLEGDFELDLLPTLDPLPRRAFRIDDFSAWSPANPELGWVGSGSYERWDPAPHEETLSLSLVTPTADHPAQYRVTSDASRTVFPFIDLTAVEVEGPGVLTIVARPTAALSRWEVLDDSELISECVECDGPDIITPIRGWFLRGTYASDSDSTSSVIDDIEIVAVGDPGSMTGHGHHVVLRRGASFEESMELRLAGPANPVTLAQPSSLTVDEPFDEIRIELVELERTGPRRLRLLLNAKLAPDVAFRRGDVDSSGSVDISDAIAALDWMFRGGITPACLASADVNDDVRHDVSDAVFLLRWLFAGGTEPPSPGPSVCGRPAELAIRCADSPCAD